MDEIELFGSVLHGVHRGNVGVYTDEDGSTYAGEHAGGKAHGHGVLTYSDGHTHSGQLADGDWHGHGERHYANGAVDYELWERGNGVHSARVRPDGACDYDFQPCGADHAGFAKLQAAAQQAGVRTCPYPHPTQATRRRPNPDARAVRFSRALVFDAWRRPAALGVRAQVCACVCVRASLCACACACVYLRVRVRARSCVRGWV